MKGFRLSVIRHGQTKANASGIYIGRTDFPLSDKGAAELEDKKDCFIYPRVPKVYTSPLTRCTETCDILFPDVPQMALPQFLEMNLGEFDGKTADQLVNHPQFLPWIKGEEGAIPPGGESVQEVQLRVMKGIIRIVQDMYENDFRHCALVTHGGIIATMLAGFGIPKIPMHELRCGYGEGYDIYISPDMWQRSGAFEILGMTPYDQVQE